MGRVRLLDKVNELIDFIKNENYETYTTKLGTVYLVSKKPYGFHFYFIHNPDASSTANQLVSEIYYDLRNKEYWIKRNTKDVAFSSRNVDTIFGDSGTSILDFISTESNQRMYKVAKKYLGAMGLERSELVGRFLTRLIESHSYFEILFKCNLIKDGYNSVGLPKIVNKDGKNPYEILGLTKTQWKMISKYNIGVDEFQSIPSHYRDSKEKDVLAIGYLDYIQSLEEEFGFDKLKDFVSNELNYLYMSPKHSRYNTYGSTLKVADELKFNHKKLIRYIYFECEASQGLDSPSNTIGIYRDYIRMNFEMENYRIEKYPRFLKTLHDIASKNYKVKLDAIMKEKWNVSYESNMQYCYANKGYKIFPPKEPEELVKEGNNLGHCVGSYTKKVAHGTSVVLFLRKADAIEESLVTIELKDNRLVQARRKFNYAPKEKEQEILDMFYKKFNINTK